MATYNHRVSYGSTQITTESGRNTMPAITYNGSTIKSAFIGNCTIQCSGEYMNTNIVIGSKTLLCANKLMSSNISVYAYGVVGAKPSTSVSKTYNGNSQNNGYTMPEHVTMTGDASGINAGTYTATYVPDTDYYWSDGTRSAVTVTMTIGRLSISGATVNLGSSLTYSGSAQTQSVSSVKISGLSATFSVTNATQTNAGNYTLTCTGTGNFTGTQTKAWSIAQKSISGATVNLNATSKTYDGSTQSVSVSSVVLSGFNPTYTVGGSTSAINVGTYTVTVTGNGNYTGTASANWTMNILSLTIPSLSNTTQNYSGSVKSVTVNNFNSSYENQSGTASATNGGTYTVSWTLKSTTNTKWSDNTTGTKSATWSIQYVWNKYNSVYGYSLVTTYYDSITENITKDETTAAIYCACGTTYILNSSTGTFEVRNYNTYVAYASDETEVMQSPSSMTQRCAPPPKLGSYVSNPPTAVSHVYYGDANDGTGISITNLRGYYRAYLSATKVNKCTSAGSYSKGSTSYGTVASTSSSSAYPSNGRHTDGYWYVKTW